MRPGGMKRKQTFYEGGMVTRSRKRVKIDLEISDLPIDVMILIFKLLTPSERRNAITVSRNWLDLVNTYFYKDHRIILTPNMDISPNGKLFKTFSDRLEITKDLRKFSQLKIQSLPDTFESLVNIPRFLDLFGDEVKSLVIEDSPFLYSVPKPVDWYNVCVYGKLPNLENLDVKNLTYLRDLRPHPTLERIKVHSTMRDFNVLNHCQSIPTIKSLTAEWFEITREDIEIGLLGPFVELDVQEKLKELLSGEIHETILLKTNFNFCGSKKLSLNDVTGMHIRNLAKHIAPKILASFTNLKELRFTSYIGDRPVILTNECVKYSGITHLQLNGLFTPQAPHFDKLLKSFPDLESLIINNNDLNDEHFAIICQYMPKLKELLLENSFSKISINAVLSSNHHSLKDLKHLERLTIETKYETLNGTTLQWPLLPHLKEVNLIGRGFRSFSQRFYTQMANNSPKITRFSVDYNLLQVMPSRFIKFLPLIRHLKLTHLTLPGEGRGGDNIPNSELVTTIATYCKDLQELTLKDGIGLLLQQELHLFYHIPSLQKISCTIISNTLTDIEREMTRMDLKCLKEYLARSLPTYKRLNDTLDYIVANIIPPHVFLMLETRMESEIADINPDFEEASNLYIVAHGFLKMKYYDLCKLIVISRSSN